jgi:aldehyde dehydrogenase (NAD+)
MDRARGGSVVTGTRLDEEENMAFGGLDVAKLVIGGELVDAEGGAVYDDIDPATELPIGQAADASERDIDAAITAARTTFDTTSWSTDVGLRLRVLRQLEEGLVRHLPELKAIATAEVGLPVTILGNTIEHPIHMIGYFADLLEKYEWTEEFGTGDIPGFPSRRWVEREAYGVVGAITPWNQPLQVNLQKIAPALAAGNTVVLKAAPTTPWMATAIGKIAYEETDMPPGVLNVITSNAGERGQELVLDPRVDLISFTGSTAVGRKIMEQGAATIKKCFLELGGKSANIVFPGADLQKAVGLTAFMCTLHGGQGCATLTRLLLPEELYEEGVAIAKAAMANAKYGDPNEMGNTTGPLNSERHRDRVEGMVERAKAEGYQPLVGGRRPPQFDKGYYYEPTLFTDLPEDQELVKNEIFGPVLVIQRYTDEDDAVRIANDSIFGLSGGVFSGDPEQARRVARRIKAGTMIVNGGIYYGFDVPFGGYKQSGIGREMGRLGFEEYLQVKALAEPV